MKKIILGVIVGLVLTSGIAYASVKYLSPLEVPTQSIWSEQLNTNHISITKFIDDKTTCYVSNVDINGIRATSSISCVK